MSRSRPDERIVWGLAPYRNCRVVDVQPDHYGLPREYLVVMVEGPEGKKETNERLVDQSIHWKGGPCYGLINETQRDDSMETEIR